MLEAPLSLNPTPGVGGADVELDGGTLVAALSPILETELVNNYRSNEISTYVVRPGDTLSGIAEMFGVDTNTIRWSNDIKYRNVIRVGQKLVILPVQGVKHKVKEGDTLAKIAKKYEADQQEIANYNKMAYDASLEVGSDIIVPNGVIASPVITSSKLTKTYYRPAASGYFMKPVNGRLTQCTHGHNGIDWGAPTGTRVVASASGEVVIARLGFNGGNGNYVAISHSNRMQTLYAHLNSINVTAGDWVNKGSLIGTVGNTGRSTGPHLHFEVRGGVNPWECF